MPRSLLCSPARAIVAGYLVCAALLAFAVWEGTRGQWHLVFFVAGIVLGFLAGLRTGLRIEEGHEPDEEPAAASERIRKRRGGGRTLPRLSGSQ